MRYQKLIAQLSEVAAIPESTGIDQIDFDLLSAVEEELTSALSFLRSLRSLPAHVHRLPPEVLAKVFHNVVNQENIHPPNIAPDLRPWITITSVCRDWRKTALSIPALWNIINIKETTLPSASAFLERSGSAPFRVYFTGVPLPPDNRETPSQRLFFTVLEDISRLEEFHLSAPTEHIPLPAFYDHFQQPAPRLHTLSLSMPVIVGHPRNLMKNCVPQTLFNNNAPNLKDVTLSFLSPWPMGYRFKNLTRFVFHNQVEGARPSLPAFLAFLADSPKLEELSIVNAGIQKYNTMLSGEEDEQKIVHLNRLKYLELGRCTNPPSMKILLRKLGIPPIAERWFHDGGGVADRLIEYFHQRAESSDVLRDATRVVLSPFGAEVGYRWLIGAKNGTLYLNHSNPAPTIPAFTTGENTLLKNVRELVYIGAERWNGRSAPKYWLTALPNLKSVSITGYSYTSARAFLYLLGGLDETAQTPLQGLPYASGLQRLHIFPLEISTEKPRRSCLEGLKFMLSSRVQKGRALESVVLEGFEEATFEKFRDQYGAEVVKKELDKELLEFDIRKMWASRYTNW